MRPTTEAHFKIIAATVRTVILERWRTDSCILSTRIGGAVLKNMHVPSRPLTVEVVAMNQAYVDRLEVMGRWPNAAVDGDHAWYAGDEWSVGIGQRSRKGDQHPVDQAGERGWPGHLVSVAYGRVLVDWSIDQVTREDHAMIVTPLAGEVTSEFMAGRAPMMAYADGHGAIWYRAHPKDTSYRQSAAWRRRDIENLDWAITRATALSEVMLAHRR